MGSIMIEPSLISEVQAIIRPEDFCFAEHREIYRTILTMRSENKPIDSVTVAAEVKMGLESVGGRKYVFDLTNQVPTALHAVHYAKLVRESHRLRRITELSGMLSRSPDDLTTTAKLKEAILDSGLAVNPTLGILEATSLYFAEIDKRVSGKETIFKTGFTTLNSMCAGGFRPGQLVTVGARTSKGKSAILLQFAATIARGGARVLFYSQEMTIPEIFDRLVAIHSRLTVSDVRRPQREHLKEINETVGALSNLGIRFGDQKNFTLEAFRADVEREKPDILIVDYIQRIQVTAGDSRASQFSNLANGLKSLALQNNVLVITASQLSRSVEMRDDHTPTLSDLKESGGIEEASDLVLLLHTKVEDVMTATRLGDMIVAKNRQGVTASFPITFEMGKTRFSEPKPGKDAF
ncbi:MAG: hypothetical protein EKK55_17310 [Rhodocyclaceae bacterium]|nr:MAG: hypothetical protein EKK55_17310 [Rhodocyclaceae bacterium]